MPYSSGTTTSQASPAKYFMESVIHPALIATGAGWTYVEETTISGATGRIYKSAAADNGSGADMYLAVIRSSDTGTAVMFALGEAWDAVNKKLQKYCYLSTSSVSLDATGRINDAAGQTVYALTSGSYSRQVGISASGNQWWLSVTAKRLVVATRVATTDNAVYAGLYTGTPSLAAAAPPLVLTDVSTASPMGGTNREPGVTSAQSISQAMAVSLAPLYSSTSLELYGSAVTLSPARLSSPRSSSAFRGYLVDVLASAYASLVNGDTITVDTDVYTVMRYGGGSGCYLAIPQAV